LGSVAVKAAVNRAGIPPEKIDEVILGNVVSAGLGQNVARQAAIGAGLSPAVGAMTVNKVCGSGLKAVMLAAEAIQCGDASAIVAGGTENMSRAPYLLDKARAGYRMKREIVDSMIRDGLWDVYGNMHMGTCGDRCAEKFGFSRQEQDAFAVTSFNRAIETGKRDICGEIEPVHVNSGKDTIAVTEDENPKKFNEEKLRKLRPAFGPNGTITAAMLPASTTERRPWWWYRRSGFRNSASNRKQRYWVTRRFPANLSGSRWRPSGRSQSC
jgi:acetyl-CoA C-acetyltransferase